MSGNSAKLGSAMKPSSSSLPTVPCKYGDKCYQKNKDHLAKFSHLPKVTTPVLPTKFTTPRITVVEEDSDTDVSLTEEIGDSEDDDENDVKKPAPSVFLPRPKTALKDGETLEVKISSTVYKVKRTAEHYHCTCPAWRNQSGVHVNARSCKHLKEVLGKPFERARCLAAKAPDSKNDDGDTVADHGRVDDDDDGDDAQDGDSNGNGSAATLPIPKRVMQDGETLQVTSKTSSSLYTIKRTGDHYYCTCPAWRNQGSVSVNARSCKHLKEVLGEAYENARSLAAGGVPPPTHNKKRSAKDDGSSRGPPAKKVKAVAPALLLAQSWNLVTGLDPTGWWLSEKLDGVRSFWDPAQKKFSSRLGNPFTAPDWFIKDLPSTMSLDGELYCGRGKFSQTVSIVKTYNSKEWAFIKFHIFDAPSLVSQPFEQRQKAIADFVTSASSKHLTAVQQQKCKDRDHLLEMLKDVEHEGGEGLMMRKPMSLYEGKRSNTLLKVKTFYDAEAEVVGYEPGKGRNKGTCGALQCKMESGKAFKVGTGLSDAERRKPPSLGSIITYRFQELTNDGVPRFPSYIGIRVDAVAAKDFVFPARTKKPVVPV